MADEPVNLNRYRKQKARAQKARDAEQNRALHGLSKKDREAAKREARQTEHAHEGKRLVERPSDPEES